MNNEKNFCIFIISNNRANNIKTLKTLNRMNCNIPIYIVIDNLDNQKDEYISLHKEKVLIFDKEYYASLVDNFDNTNNLRTTTHARNACFDLAIQLDFEYFLVLDDDYSSFRIRINDDMQYPKVAITLSNIDYFFIETLNYYKSIKAKSICFSQGGDWIGGKQFNKKVKRKAMNSFFCSTNRRFNFISRLNEDVNTYMTLGQTDNVFFTIPFINLEQDATQQNSGGMTDAYINNGTYTKSFYTVMCRPDCSKVSLMGVSNKRFHHLIDWKAAAPCIIDSKYKK